MSTDTDTPMPQHPTPNGVREYATCRPDDLMTADAAARDRGIRGAEVFLQDIRPRTLPLHDTEANRAELVRSLRSAGVRRIHSSYWAAPTAFVGNVQFGELIERFENSDRVREYFGDLTGEHMFRRWCDEYSVARELGADAFVFHLIDYMPVDGAWAFTVDRQVVLDAMIVLTQRLLRELEEHGLLTETSPVIELENAGWGLEFGAQTADDFAEVFAKVHDPCARLRLGWDLNHLLHATGLDGDRAAFLLPPVEITPVMRDIERNADGDVRELSRRWIAHNVLDPRLVERISALHVSDCPPKRVEYFRNGVLHHEHTVDGDWDERKSEGLRIVLEHYDNHVVVGDGVLEPGDVRDLIAQLAQLAQLAHKQPLMVLHELKNASDVWASIDRQRVELWAPVSAPHI